MKRITLAAVLAGFAGPAFAAGLQFDEPAPVLAPAPVIAAPAGTDWTGFYLGGQIGMAEATGQSDALGFDDEDTSNIGGITLGYNRDFGRFVLGVEGQYSATHIETETDPIDLDGIARIKARAGLDVGRALIFGTAGAAHAFGELFNEDVERDGLVVGAGMDVLVTDRVTIGGEYLHHQFNDFGETGMNLDANSAEARITLRF